MKATVKLISEMEKHSNVIEGKISKAADGVSYRYDKIVLKYDFCASFLSNLFEKAAVENNASRYARQFNTLDGIYSCSFDRAKFSSERNGKIILSKLVELN